MQILRRIRLKCTSHFIFFLIRFSFSWCGRRRKSLLYNTTASNLNVLRHYAFHILLVPPAPSDDGVLDSTVASVCNPFPFLPQVRSTPPRPHRRAGGLGQLGKDLSSTRKHWVRHGNAICCPTPESTQTATTARKSARVPHTGPSPQIAYFSLIRVH
jgi:hypothetical protein